MFWRSEQNVILLSGKLWSQTFLEWEESWWKKWELLGRLFCDDQNISDRTEPISRVLKKFHLINFFSWYLLNNKLQHNGVFRLQNFGCWKKVAASPNHLKSRTTCVLLWCFEISWWNFPLCLDKPHWTPS